MTPLRHVFSRSRSCQTVPGYARPRQLPTSRNRMAKSAMPPNRDIKCQRTTSLRHSDHCPEAERSKLIVEMRAIPPPDLRVPTTLSFLTTSPDPNGTDIRHNILESSDFGLGRVTPSAAGNAGDAASASGAQHALAGRRHAVHATPHATRRRVVATLPAPRSMPKARRPSPFALPLRNSIATATDLPRPPLAPSARESGCRPTGAPRFPSAPWPASCPARCPFATSPSTPADPTRQTNARDTTTPPPSWRKHPHPAALWPRSARGCGNPAASPTHATRGQPASGAVGHIPPLSSTPVARAWPNSPHDRSRLVVGRVGNRPCAVGATA